MIDKTTNTMKNLKYTYLLLTNKLSLSSYTFALNSFLHPFISTLSFKQASYIKYTAQNLLKFSYVATVATHLSLESQIYIFPSTYYKEYRYCF